jgi:hypothetical protein
LTVMWTTLGVVRVRGYSVIIIIIDGGTN